MQDLVRGDEIVLMSIKLLGKNVKEALRNFGSLSTKAKVYTAAGLRVDRTLIKREFKPPKPAPRFSVADMDYILPFTEPRFDYMNNKYMHIIAHKYIRQEKWYISHDKNQYP